MDMWQACLMQAQSQTPHWQRVRLVTHLSVQMVARQISKTTSRRQIWQQMLPKSPGLSLQEVRQIVRFWFNSHPAIEAWQQSHLTKCRKLKYVEAPISSRREHFYGEKIEPTKALNFPIQGTAGDIMNKAILAVDRTLGPQEQLLFQIHDELVTQSADPGHVRAVHEAAMQQTITLNGSTVKLRTETKCGKDLRNLQVMP